MDGGPAKKLREVFDRRKLPLEEMDSCSASGGDRPRQALREKQTVPRGLSEAVEKHKRNAARSKKEVIEANDC
jgi:hypothetical protein